MHNACKVFKGMLDDAQPVAIKLLISEQEEGSSAAQIKLLGSEISIMKACRFPHLVSFLGCWLEPVGTAEL